MSHCTTCPRHAIPDAAPVTGPHWNRKRMTSRGKVIYFFWHFDELLLRRPIKPSKSPSIFGIKHFTIILATLQSSDVM
jgi:hypothetical protein